jgi:alkylation response protein AidB-like acyl-CoA dehydrogenase
LEANKWAIQVLGGYGYTKDYLAEQIYRSGIDSNLSICVTTYLILVFAGTIVSI